MEENGIFMKAARKCRRCGRLLFSKDALETGYGCRCAELEGICLKAEEPDPDQMTLMDYMMSITGAG